MPFRPKTTPLYACRECRELIFRIRMRDTGRWVVCDPERMDAAPGRRIVTLDGRMLYGAADGERGFEPHYKTCRQERAARRVRPTPNNTIEETENAQTAS